MKPSPETVLDAFLLAEAIAAAGIPAGVINIVPGGRELGAYLVAHRDIDEVAFTGSTAAGRRVAETCGARLVVGGGRPRDLDRGWFVEPTVFADVDNSATIAQEEIFGPVLSVIAYGDVDDAIRIANDSDYGLGGSVWTTDAERGKDVARLVRTGTIGINKYLPDPGAPFGGVKASGIGRELGPGAISAYQQLKSIYT